MKQLLEKHFGKLWLAMVFAFGALINKLSAAGACISWNGEIVLCILFFRRGKASACARMVFFLPGLRGGTVFKQVFRPHECLAMGLVRLLFC